MLKVVFLAFTLSIGFLNVKAAYSESDEKPLSIKGWTEAETIIFMAGVSRSAATIAVMSALQKKPSLFCLPDRGITGHELWKLAESVLEGPHESSIVVIAALDELRKKYPCNK